MSQSLDKYQTSCKFCVFADIDKEEKIQVGCLAGRLDNQKNFEAYDEDLRFNVVEGLCTSYRPNTWNGGVPSLERLEKESALKGTILVDYKTNYFGSFLYKEISEFVRENTNLLVIVENDIPSAEKLEILKDANILRNFYKWNVNVLFINEEWGSKEFYREALRNVKTPILLNLVEKDDESIENILKEFSDAFLTRQKKPFIRTGYVSGVMTYVFSKFYEAEYKDEECFLELFYRLSQV